MSLFAKALWEQRRSLPTWALGLATLILLESALWPSMRDMPDLSSYLEEFPPALQELFAIDQMATGAGFLNAELFSLMLPLVVIVFGIGLGARLVAGEQEAGTLDLLLVTPLTTTRFLLTQAGALAYSVLLLGAVVLSATLGGSALFDLGVSPRAALAGALSVVLLGLAFGMVALVAGALTGSRGLAVAVASGLALAAYLLYVAGMFVDGIAPWHELSPFHLALQSGPLVPSLPWSFLWLGLVPVGLLAACLPVWDRRDL